MGCIFSTETGGIALGQASSPITSLKDLHVVQIQHSQSGSYLIPQSPPNSNYLDKNDMKVYYVKQNLMYKRTLSKADVPISYFRLSTTGVFTHFFTDLIVASETDDIENGRALSLRTATGQENDKFSFNLTEAGLLQHKLTGLCIQPENNSVNDGAKICAYPHDPNTNIGASSVIQFKLVLVPIDELEHTIAQKEVGDRELKFAESSDGKFLAAEKVRIEVSGNEERTSLVPMFNAEIARVSIGINRLILATFSSPSMNISCTPDGKFSLNHHADEAETWSIFPVDVGMTGGYTSSNSDEVFGRMVRICNKNGSYLCMQANGALIVNFDEGSVWNILLADKHMYYLVNEKFPFALQRDGNKLVTVPKMSEPDTSMYWNVYDA